MAESPESTELDVAHLARLAQLALTETEKQQASADLGNIVAMIDAMQDIDTDGIEPMAHPHDATARLRNDTVTESVDPAHFQAHAPEVADGFYLVPRVVD